MADTPKFEDTSPHPEDMTEAPRFEDTEPHFEDTLDSGPSKLESFGRGVAQGGTLGFADELTALLESALSSKKYNQALGESREAYKQAAEANPKTSFLGELGGGLGAMAIPGLGIGKEAQLAELIGKGALFGGIQGVGKSESNTVGGNVASGVVGAGLGAAGGALFPQLGKLYSPAETALGRVGQVAGLTGLGAAGGGAYGALTASPEEDILERTKNYAELGGGLAGLSRSIPAATRAIGNTGFGEKVARAYQLGKENIPIFGKQFEEHLAGKTKDFSQDLAQAAQEEFAPAAVAARQQTESTAQNLVAQIEDQKKLVGENINNIFARAEKQGNTARFNEILDPLETLKHNVTEVEKPALRPVEKVLKKFEIYDHNDQFMGYRSLGAAELRELRNAIFESRNYSKGISSDLGKTLRDVYNNINESVGKVIDNPTDLEALKTYNQKYSALSNLQDEFLPEGKFNLMEKENLPGPQVFKYLKGLPNEQKLPGEGLNEQAITGILNDVNPDVVPGIQQQLGQAPLDQAKYEALTQAMGTEPAAKAQIASFETPSQYASSKTEQGINELANLNPEAASRIKGKGEDVAKLMELSGSRFDPERNIGTVSTPGLVGAVVRKGAYPIANVVGLAKNKLSELSTAPTEVIGGLVNRLESKGHSLTANYLKSLADKDTVGRNAIMFTLMQTPDRRKELEDVMSEGNE